MASLGGGGSFMNSIRRIKLTNAILLSVGGVMAFTVSNSLSDSAVTPPQVADEDWYNACCERAEAAAAEARAASNEAKAAAVRARAAANEVKALAEEIKAALANES